MTNESKPDLELLRELAEALTGRKVMMLHAPERVQFVPADLPTLYCDSRDTIAWLIECMSEEQRLRYDHYLFDTRDQRPAPWPPSSTRTLDWRSSNERLRQMSLLPPSIRGRRNDEAAQSHVRSRGRPPARTQTQEEAGRTGPRVGGGAICAEASMTPTPAETVRAVAERLWPGHSWNSLVSAKDTRIWGRIGQSPEQIVLRPDSLDSLRLCLSRCSEGQREAFRTAYGEIAGWGRACARPVDEPLLTPLPDLWSALLRALDEAGA